MIKLFHCSSARSFRPLWTLEEMGLTYELVMLPFPPRVLAKTYLETNPLGTVPFLVDGSTRMTESAAMCEYIVTAHGPSELAVEPGRDGYGDWLNALHQGEATLTFPQTIVLRYGRFERPDRQQPQVVKDYGQWFLARLRWIEAVLADHEYLAADRFTAADISVGYALMLAEVTELSGDFPPNVQAYWERLTRRDGYLRALEAQARAAREQNIEVTT